MKNFWRVTGLALLFCTPMMIFSAAQAQAQAPTPNPPPTQAERAGKVLVDKNGKEVGNKGGDKADKGGDKGGNKSGPKL